MKTPKKLESRFTQTLDRAAFATYFVGAIVPLLAFALVTQRFVLPAMGDDSRALWTVIGFFTVVGLLSLAAFLTLRRLVHRTLERMNADNLRLGEILRASRVLSEARHGHAVADTSARCALELTGAQAVLVMLRASQDKDLSLCESTGQDAAALYQSSESELSELVEQALASREPCRLELGAEDPALTDERPSAALALPFGGEEGIGGVLLALHTAAGAEFATEQVDALSTLCSLTSVALKSADLQDAQRNFFTHVTEILVTALDTHVDQREGHGTSVAQVSNRIGRELGIDDQSMQRLHFSALLHDIGMLKIPRSQHGNFTVMRMHPVLGHRMLSHIRLWGDVAPVVLHHHEHFDGSGSPDGLEGDTIPLESRIIHLADAFDLLIRGEADGVPFTPAEALEKLRGESGSRFDPVVVRACAAVIERGDL